jgi:uncharacterized membrane protein YfcA
MNAHASSMPRVSRNRRLELLAIGTAAGVFSGLFGVGGGMVMVPLLILWLGYDERTATGTSLAAIIVISAVGATAQAVYGNLHVDDGLLVGVPAVGGVLLGTWLQQRVSMRVISALFSLLLTVLAVDLVVTA